VFTPVIRLGRNTQTLAMLGSLISNYGVRRLTPHRVLWYFSVYPKRPFKITIPSLSRRVDPFTIEVIRNAVTAIAEEMSLSELCLSMELQR
jgi:hypothetical protein